MGGAEVAAVHFPDVVHRHVSSVHVNIAVPCIKRLFSQANQSSPSLPINWDTLDTPPAACPKTIHPICTPPLCG